MLNVGQKFTQKYVLNEATYRGFINTFNDLHALHTIEEYAKARGFNGRVMHGNILNGFLSNFVGMHLPLPEVIILSEEIRYKTPVYLNDNLTLEVVIAEIHESVNVVELACKFIEESNNKIVALAKLNVGVTSAVESA